MHRLLAMVFIWLAATAGAAAEPGELRIEIDRPTPDLQLESWETSAEVEGGASIFGGVKYLDLFLVLDTSKSLQRTDPKDHRVAGAAGLVRALPRKSNIRIGLVDFDRNAELVTPLTPDREAVIRSLKSLDQTGATDLAEGIETALAGFAENARPDSSRVMLLFTDGKSNEKDARRAMERARAVGVAIHTLQLGSDDDGADILREIAMGTGGSFTRVRDPSQLPEAFANLRTTGIESVTLRVNGSAPQPTKLAGGRFLGRVPLSVGENRIVATATALDGRTRDRTVTIIVSGPLDVAIETPADGRLYEDTRSEETVTGSVSSFSNPSPELLARNPDRGVRSVVLSVNGSPPFATTVHDGRFEGRVMLREGENRIVATATSHDGRTAEDLVRVNVRPPGCAELAVVGERDGEPAFSISDRVVELVFDASNSMWAQIDGRAKMAIGKEILTDALDWLPGDLSLALRVYGHQHPREQRNCRDSELMVPAGTGNRDRIRQAIDGFRPRGQTPLGYSLEQIQADLSGFSGERAVVLVTDGIESCGGDPVAAARSLRETSDTPVHVIGFGLGSADESDLAGLRDIADASGGRFLTARDARELREAISATVGTSFRVSRAGETVASGTLGTDDVVRLSGGEYVVELDSSPSRRVPVTLASEQSITLTLARDGDAFHHRTQRVPAAYSRCAAPAFAPARRPVPARPE